MLRRFTLKSLKKAFRYFFIALAKEGQETKEAGKILFKYSSGEKLTSEEKKQFKDQFYDILKGIGIGIPFILLPGAGIILAILTVYAKRKKINLFPSSFYENTKDTKDVDANKNKNDTKNDNQVS